MAIKLTNFDDLMLGLGFEDLINHNSIVVRRIPKNLEEPSLHFGNFEGKIQKTKTGERYALCGEMN